MNLEVYNQIKSEMAGFPQGAGLLAVTKYSGVADINEAISQGVSAIGENRLEAALEKFPDLEGNVEKHFIGVLQTKKIRKLVELFDVIESVGTIGHLKKIDDVSGELGKNLKVLLQFNISGEEQKSGFLESDIPEIVKEIKLLKNIKVIGIMGMASQSSDKKNREEFVKARIIRDNFKEEFPSISELSIGMSHDYLIALEEGATIIRIGSKLFK